MFITADTHPLHASNPPPPGISAGPDDPGWRVTRGWRSGEGGGPGASWPSWLGAWDGDSEGPGWGRRGVMELLGRPAARLTLRQSHDFYQL